MPPPSPHSFKRRNKTRHQKDAFNPVDEASRHPSEKLKSKARRQTTTLKRAKKRETGGRSAEMVSFFKGSENHSISPTFSTQVAKAAEATYYGEKKPKQSKVYSLLDSATHLFNCPWYEATANAEEKLAHSVAISTVPSTHKGEGKRNQLAYLLRIGQFLLKYLAQHYRRAAAVYPTDRRQWLEALSGLKSIKEFASSSKTKQIINRKGGTLADRVSALTVLVQQSPLVNIQYLQLLLTMANKQNRSERFLAIDALTDLFIQEILPNRKLKFFEARLEDSKVAGNNQSILNHILKCIPDQWVQQEQEINLNHWKLEDPTVLHVLILWSFEDTIKAMFAAFAKILANLLNDSVFHSKWKAMNTMYQLLLNKPEQEHIFMECIVNKLSGNSPKLGSISSKFLVSIIEQHPPMKRIVIQYINNSIMHYLAKLNPLGVYQTFNSKVLNDYTGQFILILRPLLFLSELKYKRSESLLATDVFHIYLSVFDILFDEKYSSAARFSKRYLYVQQNVNRVVRVILNGINRAFPYMKNDIFPNEISQIQRINERLETLYKAVHLLPIYSSKIIILSLLFKILQNLQTHLDRFYRVLYELLQDISLFKTKNVVSLFTLIFHLLLNDFNACRSLSMVKRLMQATIHLDPPALCLSSVKLCSLLVSLPLSPTLSPLSVMLLDGAIVKNAESKLQEKDELFMDVEEEKSDDEESTGHLQKQNNSIVEPCLYNPMKRDPRFSKADESHFWESLFCTVSYHPCIAEEAASLRQYIRDGTYRKNLMDKKQLNTVNDSSYHVEDLVHKNSEAAELESKQKLASFSNNLAVDLGQCMSTFNTTAFLEYVCCHMSNIPVSQSTPSSNFDKVTLAAMPATSKYWMSCLEQNKIQSHERWISQYYTDPYVIYHGRHKLLRSKQGKTEEGVDDTAFDADAIVDSDEETDAFADKLLANELKSAESNRMLDDDSLDEDNNSNFSFGSIEGDESSDAPPMHDSRSYETGKVFQKQNQSGKRKHYDGVANSNHGTKKLKPQTAQRKLNNLKEKMKANAYGSFADASEFDEFLDL